MELELDVFMLSDDQENMLELGVSVDFSDSRTSRHTFYNISYITPYNKNFCSIICDGIQLICCDNYKVASHRIRQARMKCLN